MEKLVCLYDKKEEVYKNIACIDTRYIDNYFTELANDPQSNCYGIQDEFMTCYFNPYTDEDANFEKNGNIAGRFIIDKELLTYVNDLRIQQQNMVKVLNYLPVGYFKMPAEMQKDIKEQIDNAVKEYAQYLVDNADIKINGSEEPKEKEVLKTSSAKRKSKK